MKLIMAVSADGFVARGEEDSMRWTGAVDKAVFRILTGLDGGRVAVGWRTAAMMPRVGLMGRTVIGLRTRPDIVADRPQMTLVEFANAFPNGWLAGGQTIALAALERDLVDEVVLCRSTDRLVFHGVSDKITPWLIGRRITEAMRTTISDVTVSLYRTGVVNA